MLLQFLGLNTSQFGEILFSGHTYSAPLQIHWIHYLHFKLLPLLHQADWNFVHSFDSYEVNISFTKNSLPTLRENGLRNSYGTKPEQKTSEEEATVTL